MFTKQNYGVIYATVNLKVDAGSYVYLNCRHSIHGAIVFHDTQNDTYHQSDLSHSGPVTNVLYNFETNVRNGILYFIISRQVNDAQWTNGEDITTENSDGNLLQQHLFISTKQLNSDFTVAPDTVDPGTVDPGTGNTDTGNTDTGNTDTGNTDTGNTEPKPVSSNYVMILAIAGGAALLVILINIGCCCYCKHKHKSKSNSPKNTNSSPNNNRILTNHTILNGNNANNSNNPYPVDNPGNINSQMPMYENSQMAMYGNSHMPTHTNAQMSMYGNSQPFQNSFQPGNQFGHMPNDLQSIPENTLKLSGFGGDGDVPVYEVNMGPVDDYGAKTKK